MDMDAEPFENGDATPPTKESGSWLLDKIVIENFKSYKNLVRVEALQTFQFIAIIGPNGSGKSNLMDAISFVMGERASCLRVKRLDELIHGASIGKPIAKTASVSVVFKRRDNDSQDEMKFSRVIRGANSEYFLNEMLVSQQTYISQLRKLGINPKAKNFLVFQGAIENVAMKNAKERAVLLEEICGSGAYKADYDQTKLTMQELEKKIEVSYLKKKGLIAERKEVKLEVKEAAQYNELLEEVAQKETEIVLFKLYHLNKKRSLAFDDVTKKEYDVKKLETMKGKNEATFKNKKQERAMLNQELNGKENLLSKIEKEKNMIAPKLIEANQKRKHIERKLQGAEKSLKQAQENKSSHESDLQALRRNLETIEKDKEAFMELHETQTGGDLDITLRDSQMTEYWELKQKVLKKTQKDKLTLDTLEREKKDKDEVYQSLNREKTELSTKSNLISNEISSLKKLAEKIQENVSEFQEQLQAKEAEAQPLKRDIQKAETNLEQLQEELEAVSGKLETAKTDRHEIERQIRKNETIAALKTQFSGVIDRVSDLFIVGHEKYKVAITKIMGKNLDSIVVDSEKTARHCIQYLKEQMIEPESFLPLDFLQVKPLRTYFRDLGDSIRLAYDLLHFDKRVERAILHCTKSTVVCPTSSLASAVASGHRYSEATNAVSLEGTFYSTTGIISGGLADLQRKAARWGTNDISNMHEEKKRIQEEIRENVKISRRKVDLRYLEQEILGIKNRLKYANAECNSHNEKAANLEASKQRLETQCEEVDERLAKAKEEVSRSTVKLNSFTKKLDAVEDKIFAEFCGKIGIPNIRSYEEKDVRAQEEFNREKQSFDNKIQEIEAQIEYEISQESSYEDNQKRWENTVAEMRQNLENFKMEEQKKQDEMDKIDTKLSKIQKEFDEIKNNIDSKEKEVAEANKMLTKLDKAVVAAQKEKNLLENSLYQIKLNRHELYKQCKLSGTNLPLNENSAINLDNIYTGSETSRPPANTGETETNETQGVVGITPKALDVEDRISVNFEGLSSEMKSKHGDGIKKTEKELLEDLHEMEKNISVMQGPNMKADQLLAAIKSKAQQHELEFEKMRKEVKEARDAFEKVKKERYDKFMACYEKISQNIDGIYKGLTQNESAQAILDLENPEEPYLEGVSYHCVAPGKRFQSMSNLSGGEKTLAALALLFAIHSYEPTPFFVLDEIDAALDNTNIGKVSSYIRRKAKDCQFLVISLKEEFFENASALVGVAPDVNEVECICSKLYTLDLTRYL